MPAFDGVLKIEEIKAVSVFVFSHAGTSSRSTPLQTPQAGKTRR
jgi:hypothetical protein